MPAKESFIHRRVFILPPGNLEQAGFVCSEVRRELADLAVEKDLIRRAGVVCFEGEMNIAMYSDGGRIILVVADDRVELLFSDRGPGIPDIELARTPGYSTAPDWARELGFGAGIGIPNMEHQSDRLEIRSRLEGGTVLRAVFRRGEGDCRGGSEAPLARATGCR